ncbi:MULTISPECIES: hypothetical protein [unclassified Caballeronia]|uniref:hypothetical protein n=1 Tax=unclassified Caballeronia TaxID=2646786 RepID=UPI0028663ACF|nr:MULTISPECIES: hypothetical protein [unclassified Caballeronia]MDR5777590.1 hypothetical protein [Caballeronia sp. LZ002]MDR5853036.1 hypothetical protein [Caballeronia sp. LZ003]
MVKRCSSWPVYVPAGTKNVGTARVREDMTVGRDSQQRALAQKYGTQPNSEVDEIMSGFDPVVSQVLAARGAATSGEAARKALQALGRLRDGEQNATERRYEAHLEQQRRSGEIQWYMFEGIKLKLAPRTFLTVDYVVLPASGVLEMHDVKGARAIFSDDAKVKMKVAAWIFPLVFKVVYPRKARDGGGWDVEEI